MSGFLERLSDVKKDVISNAEAVQRMVLTGGEEIPPNVGSFCVVGIFKNESEVLNEWLKHYTNEGCSRFFLIDNGSDDNYKIDDEYKDLVDVVIDATKHAQAQLYNQHFGEKIKSYNWTLVCDLDEFVYSRKSFKTIRSYLKSVSDPNVTQIAIPWKIFGSNGYDTEDKKEPSSVIDAFTKRIDYDKDEGFQGVQRVQGDHKFDLCKCVIRSHAVKRLNVHVSETKYGRTVQSQDITVPTEGLPFAPMNESRLKASPLALNHYAIRSLDWYTRVKMTRGSAESAAASDQYSKIKYFHDYDKVSNDIDDFELRNKTYGKEKNETTSTSTEEDTTSSSA